MKNCMVVLIAATLMLGAVALVVACDVSTPVEEGGGSDATGGGSDGGPAVDGGGAKDAGEAEDAGGKTDTGNEDGSAGGDVPPPDDTGVADGGGGEDAASSDAGPLDGGGQDTGPQGHSISGVVTVEGKKPVNQVLAVVLNQPPSANVAPVGYTLCDADGKYTIDQLCDDHGNCTPLVSGPYWVAAIYDSNNDGNFDPKTGDAYAFHPGNPVVVAGSDVTGVDMDILFITVAVTSVYVDAMPPQIPTAGAYLMDLGAAVFDPAGGGFIADAVVKVTDGVSPAVYTLIWDAVKQSYVMDKSGQQQLIAAVDGNYEFSITHAAFGPSPVLKHLRHRPLAAAPAISAPSMNTQYNTPQEVTVAWTDPPPSQPFALQVQEAKQNGQVVYEKPAQGTNVPPKSPEKVPASAFKPATTYVIRVIDGRIAYPPAGQSYELGMGQVVVGFK